MIKIFRKIRQNLLSEGKTGRYLTYAIGEIVLVVIGILLALAISNWNSNRIEKNRNQQLLIKLSKELDRNIERCIVIRENIFEKRVQFSDSTLLILNKGITIKDLNFIFIKQGRGRYYTATLNLQTNIFEQLKNTGSLYSIASDSLVEKIQDYYQLCERESFYNLEIGKIVDNRKEKCYEGFFAFHDLYKLNPTKAISQHDWIFDPSSKDYIYLQQFIIQLKNHSIMMVNKISGIERESKNLKQLISKEIDR